MPAVEIDVILGLEPAQFLFEAADIVFTLIEFKLGQLGQHLLLDSTKLVLFRVEDFQAVPPRELPFYHIDRVLVFIIDIVAVEP